MLNQSCALSGLGGVGKTQTAIEYAYRYATDYMAIFWVSAETSKSILSSFAAIADMLKLPEKEGRDQSRMVAAVTLWLTNHHSWLLIFDNVEDLELVKRFLPPARHGSLLLTTRRQAPGLTSQSLDIEPMTPVEGLCFLLHRARWLDPAASLDHLAPTDVALAQEIAVATGGLPLALDQVGAYIEATQCGLSDYLQIFRSSQHRLLDERDAHADHPLSVSKTFALIFEQLEQSHPLAVEFLTACAFLAPDEIPETFFLEGAAQLGPTFEALAADPLQFNATLKVLLSYSLLQRNASTKTLTIHHLAQVVLTGYLSQDTRRRWAGHMIRAMAYLFPLEIGTRPNDWLMCDQLLFHALICLTLGEQLREGEVLHLITLRSRVATYLAKRGRFNEAELLYKQALCAGEQALGREHLLVAEVLHGMANLYGMQGKYTEAEPLFHRAVRMREQTLGLDHP